MLFLYIIIIFFLVYISINIGYGNLEIIIKFLFFKVIFLKREVFIFNNG